MLRTRDSYAGKPYNNLSSFAGLAWYEIVLRRKGINGTWIADLGHTGWGGHTVKGIARKPQGKSVSGMLDPRQFV
jgi:hypothetical protein